MTRQGKYYSGTYAVCASCSSRPCICGDQAAAPAPADNVRSLTRPASGNAIPFVVWDELIARYELSIVESGVLLYLCRVTIGYGKHAGDLISISRVAAALRISARGAQNALNTLQRHGLIERNRRYERNSREHGTTHITVCLPPLPAAFANAADSVHPPVK